MGKIEFVVDEAFKAMIAQGCERKDLYLVKDQGVYMMAGGEAAEDNKVCYARGFNPSVDDFDDWYDTSHDILGGDDFAEPLTDYVVWKKFCEAALITFEFSESHYSVTAS